MDPISGIVSGLSLTVIVVVSVVLFINSESAKKSMNSTIKEVVDQINDSQYYAYRFDKKQEDNLKNLDTNIDLVNKKIENTDKTLVSKEKALDQKITTVDQKALPKDSLVQGVPYVRTGKLQLGDQYLLSGVGDVHSQNKPDGWLRLMNKDGKDYYGGVAMANLWTRDNAWLNGTATANNMNVTTAFTTKGGKSVENPNNGNSHFPWTDGKNYIRGDTEVQGNTVTSGNVSIGKNLNVDGRIHFKDQSFDTKGSAANNADSYYLEKKVEGNNNSSLRLTMNDDADESLQIWGGACAAGNCNGEGTMKHRLGADGNAWHGEWMDAKNVNGRDHVTTANWAAWMRNNGDMHARNRLGVGIHPDNQGNFKMFVDGGVDNQWSSLIRHGPTHVYMGHNKGYGMHINTQKGGGEYALEVYSANGELMRVGNEGTIRLGRHDGNGEVKTMPWRTNVRRHIDAWNGYQTNNDQTLFAGYYGKKVVLGNNATSGLDYMSRNTPLDSVVSLNPTYVQSQLKVARGKDDKMPQNWNGIHTWDLYSNGTIGTGQNGQIAAYMNGAGDIYTVKGALTGSDIKLKENVKTVSKEDLSKISDLKPVTYTLKDDKTKQKQFGFIAQDVEGTYPNLVSESKDGTKAVNYNSFVPLVVGNVQEMRKTIPNDKQICIGKTCLSEEDLIKLKKTL